MKLKTRILISFFVIILLPLILAGVALMGFTSIQLSTLEKQYNIDEVTYETLSNNTDMLNMMVETVVSKLQQITKEEPEYLEKRENLDELNSELFDKGAYLLVRKDESLFYNGSENDVSNILLELPSYGAVSAAENKGIYIGHDVKALVKQVDFEFTDGSQGTVFVIIHTAVWVSRMREMALDMLVMIIIILILTSLFLCFWMYRGVITPLNQLQQATHMIKEGNLDFTIKKCGVSEISELCEDFDEMRQRLKQNAEEKLKADNENRELISNISHDLKTPITAIKGYVEGIMDGVADTPEKMQRYIRTIYTKANDMDTLINELTFYSKIDTNRIPYVFNKIYIREYFEDCVYELQQEMNSRNIQFTYFDYLDENPIVIADAEQLKRVINNIISNSCKYMDKEQKVINIRLKDVGDFIQIEIEDNGKGIAVKDLANIFDRFYRTDASRNSSTGGSGIGLSIVKKIMEDHGGQVWATSKEGTGTTMYLALRKYQEVPINE